MHNIDVPEAGILECLHLKGNRFRRVHPMDHIENCIPERFVPEADQVLGVSVPLNFSDFRVFVLDDVANPKSSSGPKGIENIAEHRSPVVATPKVMKRC